MNNDPLALASETPDVAALIKEFEYAQNTGPCRIENLASAEDIRLNRWEGKSSPPDGCKWQRNAPSGKIVRPWDGRPDTEQGITDEICEMEVDLALLAGHMAVIGASTTHVAKLTAAQVSEFTAVARWVRQVTEDDREDDEELLAQMVSMIGWAVLNPGWCERSELIERELDLESFVTKVGGIAGPDAARQLYTAILDPTFEEAAVFAVQKLFAYVPKNRVRKIVRDLRETQTTKFLDKQIVEKRPTIRTLIPGYNYFVSGGAASIGKARGHLVVERVWEAQLRQMAADNGWNQEFVEAVLSTAGKYSTYGEAMRDRATLNNDADDKSIEIWTTTVFQFDDEIGAGGIYCTTFSPHLKPGGGRHGTAETPKAYYAHHYLLAFAHGQAPFIEARREVTGPALDDSRGVPEITRGNQKVLKDLQDAGVARAQLEVDPPRFFSGVGSTKIGNWNAPGAKAESLMPGADVKEMGPSRGNPAVSEAAMERIQRSEHRRFALPDPEMHPAKWQPRQMRRTKRALAPWRQAYWQLVVLCYQELDPFELAQIIGQFPQLTVEDLLRHRVTLTFDARSLDADWRKDTLDTLIKLLSIDKGGAIDTGLVIRLIGNYVDPTMMQEIIRDPQGAQAALYRQVEGEMMSIMDGNPPQMSEGDATAEMQLRMAFQVIGQNQEYQKKLMSDPAIQENLKAWLKNKQHNVQETQLSPTQGRLGVAQMPQSPVRTGAPPALTDGSY